MVVHEGLHRHGRILRAGAGILLLLDGLANDTDGRGALLLVLVQPLAQLAHLRGELGKVGWRIVRRWLSHVSAAGLRGGLQPGASS